jgi:2,3-bisphosphoglycerate-independent phosphoglycerate mutase
MARPKPVVLAILDGWGVAPDAPGNAITRAHLPHMDKFVREYPVMSLFASGTEVGLSFGEMGNSEVGHLNIGAGRVYYQTFPRIQKHILDGSFFTNSAFVEAATHVKTNKSALHLMGLVSPGNVHASEEHCLALLKFAKQEKIKNVFIHVFLDGRDTVYNGGKEFVARLEAEMKKLGVGKIASVSGRFFAMDRDNRWERVEPAYRAIAEGKAPLYGSALEAIEVSYAKGVFDEEFVPAVIGKGVPIGVVKPHDAVIFFNFRPDRARELTKAFVLPSFAKFDRTYIEDVFFVTMTEYEKEIPVRVAYPPQVIPGSLAETISAAGLTQLHVAETEKYAHVTFFLNGTVEEPFPGESREIIPSPRVSSYEQAPEMAAPDIAKAVVSAIEGGEHDVIICNFANADMVGHTGSFEATIKGCEAIDKALGLISDHVLSKDGVLLITADHGNAEETINLQTSVMDKEHSTNPVPLIIISKAFNYLIFSI